MKVTVEKVDDINFILSGLIPNALIEAKVAALKATMSSEDEAENSKEERLQQEAASAAFKEFIEAGVKEADIDIDALLGQPALKKYEQQGESVYFEVELATSPFVDTSVDCSDVIPAYTKPQADPQAVEEKFNAFVKQQSPFEAIETPRALQEGDVAVIDFTGYLEGVPFEGGHAERFNLKIGSNSFIAGFEEQLVGMAYGEERKISVTFPVEYQAADLAGKETEFVVKLHEIQEQKIKEVDDAFAKKILNDQNATIATLKEKFADQVISEEVSRVYMSELKPKMVAALLKKFDFTLPNNVVEQEIDARVTQISRGFSEEEHKMYAQNKGKFMELRESLRSDARDTIKIALIVEALAKKEGIEVHEQEVHAALGYQAMMSGQNAQELLKYYEENNLMKSAILGLTEDKLFGMMLGFHKA